MCQVAITSANMPIGLYTKQAQDSPQWSQHSQWSRQLWISGALQLCGNINVPWTSISCDNARVKQLIWWLQSPTAVIVQEIQIPVCRLSVAVTLYTMNGKLPIPGARLCFRSWCHVFCTAMTGTVDVSGHRGPFSNQLYKWAWVWRAGEMLSITLRPSGGAAGVCVESPPHTDPYKQLCDVLEQMSRGRLWRMTDSSFDSPGKVCSEVSI